MSIDHEVNSEPATNCPSDQTVATMCPRDKKAAMKQRRLNVLLHYGVTEDSEMISFPFLFKLERLIHTTHFLHNDISNQNVRFVNTDYSMTPMQPSTSITSN